MRTRPNMQHDQPLSGVDERYIQAVYRYHMLKPEQLTRRYYRRGSLNSVKARLKNLVDQGYLEANEQPTIRGRSPYYYTLANKGMKYLKEIGVEVNQYYRPNRKASYLPFLLHTFTVNDFLIAAELVAEDIASLTLAELQHELFLKHNPCQVTIKPGRMHANELATTKHVSIVPDGWLDFRYDRGEREPERRMCIWLEIDRGTVGMKDFKEKVAAIVEFYTSGAYQARFGTNSLRVAFATSGSSVRVKQMRTWLCDVLTKQPAKSGIADRFLCTVLPSEIDPRTLFLAPIWYLPFDNTPPVSLLVTE